MIEFADFECGYCSKIGETTKALLAKYPGKIRLVYRDFPLNFHPNATTAAVAARCSGAQGKFWEMHDLLFDNQQNLNPDQYMKFAKDLALDIDAFKKCSDDPSQTQAVQNDLQEGSKVGISGTPAFFINGIALSGAQPLERFIEIIEKELNRTSQK